ERCQILQYERTTFTSAPATGLPEGPTTRPRRVRSGSAVALLLAVFSLELVVAAALADPVAPRVAVGVRFGSGRSLLVTSNSPRSMVSPGLATRSLARTADCAELQSTLNFQPGGTKFAVKRPSRSVE